MSSQEAGRNSAGGSAQPVPQDDVDRRDFLGRSTTLAMAGGLIASYGTFCAMAGRYLFPSTSKLAWMFVARVAEIEPGGSLAFESPAGLKLVVTRRGGGSEANAGDQFIALSSTCPHLGCRVQWEPQNNRFFCPCHNGVFDPQGRAISGPPKAANQELPRYPLKVEDGLLFIELPVDTVVSSGERVARSRREPEALT